MTLPAQTGLGKADATKFVAVSAYYPPIVGGTATVIRNLLSAFRPECVRVVSESPAFLYGQHQGEIPDTILVTRLGLPAVLRRLPFGRLWVRAGRYAMMPRIRRNILQEISTLGAQRLLAVYPSWPFFIAAHQAATQASIPLAVYLMDATVGPAQAPWPDRRYIRRYESEILQKADVRLVLSEALAVDLQQRFGLASVVVRHSIAEPSPLTPALSPVHLRQGYGGQGGGEGEKPLHLVHTGVVEQLQYEGLKRLAETMVQHPELRAKLTLCTPNNPQDLISCGLGLPGVEIVSLTNEQVRALQRSASVLVAVLPFHGKVKALDLTAFPTKVIEYLVAGAPILAHAPPASFFARHARQHGYALLVDEPTESALLAGLLRLREDAALRQELRRNAQRTVSELFALPKVARTFAAACGLNSGILKPEFVEGMT